MNSYGPTGVAAESILVSRRGRRGRPLTDLISVADAAGFAPAVERISCARLAVIGADAAADVAGLPLPLVERVRERRGELEAMRLNVREIPGAGTGLMFDAATVRPILRRFLDEV